MYKGRANAKSSFSQIASTALGDTMSNLLVFPFIRQSALNRL